MKRRIIICLGILLALFLVGGVTALLCMESSINKLTALAESHRIQSMRADLVSDATRIETDLLAYRSGHRHHAQQRISHLRRFGDSLDRCGRCHHEPDILAKHDAVRDTFEAYRAEEARLYSEADPTNRAALEDVVQDLVDRLVVQTTRMADQADRHLFVRSTDVMASVRAARLSLVGTILASLVVGGIVAFHLKGRLTRPVEAMLKGIEQVRNGELDHSFAIEGDEEFRALADAFDQAYASLEKAHESMVQTEKMASIGKLAAGIAHEIGNPLASISSIAQMMRREETSAQNDGHNDLLMEQIARISRIVRDLLSFARPGRDKEHGPVFIGTVLEQATTLLSYDPRASAISISQQHDINLRPVLGDGDKLLLVFTNILINAFDAIAARGEEAQGSIRISAKQDKDDVVIRVQDDGTGMREEQIAAAFEPFFTTKAPGEGTGLGLWICYQTVERHHGSIRIDSRVGEGTTVVIRLPSAPPGVNMLASPAAAESRQP